MSNLSFLELNTIYSESHINVHSYLKNEQQERIGELEVYILDDSIKDLKIASGNLEEVDANTINSFEVKYDGFIYEEGITPFERTPYIIWGRVALISKFYINPKKRKKGYGKQVLNKLIKILKDVYRVDFIILKPYPLFGTEDEGIIEEVPTKRVIAEYINSLVSFYEKFGFRTQKINKQYYQCLCLLDYIFI